MIIAGLTGSIGSGKSTVAGFFKSLGAHIIDWDILAHEIFLPDRKAWQEIVLYFGAEILDKDRTIDRQKLAGVVFNHPDKLKKLNQITHPEIMKEDKKKVEKISKHDPDAVILKEIPLLSKDNAHQFVKKVIVVYASENNQIKRLLQRNLDEKEAKKRILAQPSLSEKLEFADFVIYNNGSFEETKKQVENIYNILKREASSADG